MKHTKGPWSAYKLGNTWGVYSGDKIKADRYSIGGFECEICEMNEDDEQGPGKLEQKGNAHLIAAAPELLEACKRLLVCMKLANWEDDDSAIFARAAIQKATGE